MVAILGQSLGVFEASIPWLNAAWEARLFGLLKRLAPDVRQAMLWAERMDDGWVGGVGGLGGWGVGGLGGWGVGVGWWIGELVWGVGLQML